MWGKNTISLWAFAWNYPISHKEKNKVKCFAHVVRAALRPSCKQSGQCGLRFACWPPSCDQAETSSVIGLAQWCIMKSNMGWGRNICAIYKEIHGFWNYGHGNVLHYGRQHRLAFVHHQPDKNSSLSTKNGTFYRLMAVFHHHIMENYAMKIHAIGNSFVSGNGRSLGFSREQ